MKRIKRITTLLLALMMVLLMSQIVYAENGGTFTYRGGDTIEGDANAQKAIDFSGLEPGDSMSLDFTYVNESDATTTWYLSNDVVTSLEDDTDATNGGYTYILKNNGVKEGEQILFSSDAVGGDEKYDPDKKDTGLHDAVNALGEDWIYIDELAPGERGTTTLTVALDGESQTNVYEDRDGTLKIAYAVEEQAPGETIIIPNNVTKTGDSFNPLYAILALTAALLAILLAVLSYFKDRKDGEEA